MFAAAIMLMTTNGCKKDSDTTEPAKTTTYDLKAKDVLGVTGKVTFTETSSTTTTVSIVLTSASAEAHPADLCTGSAVEGGGIHRVLTPVDASGKSSTIVDIAYSTLIAFDGYIKVLKSTAEPTVVIALGDIGGNVITTTNKSYSLSAVNSSGVTGTAKFEKRVNGNTLVTISLTGAVPGSYPATINVGSITTTGPETKILNNVDGTTGKGYTNIRDLLDGTPYTYDQWIVYTGYLNIYQTSIGTANIICHGNIGSN
jgi:hypothetical protein